MPRVLSQHGAYDSTQTHLTQDRPNMTHLNLLQECLFCLSQQEPPHSLTYTIYIHVLTHTKHTAVAMMK